jgi:DNA-binding transcriptional regulator YiaG
MTQLITEADRAAELHRLIGTGAAIEIRKRAKLSLAVVGRSIGAHSSAVGRWERGERRPVGEPADRYLDLLQRLAKAFQ